MNMDHGLCADNPIFFVNGEMDNAIFFDKALEVAWRQVTGISRKLYYKVEPIGMVFYWHKVENSMEISYPEACIIAWEYLKDNHNTKWQPIPDNGIYRNFIGEIINGWTCPPDPYGDAWEEDGWIIVRGEWGHVTNAYSSFLIRPAYLWIGK